MDFEILALNEKTWCFHEGFVRAFLLAGREKALLVDTCMNVSGIRAKAEELTGLPVELINTHCDPDHTGANGEFERFYMHPAEEEKLRRFRGLSGELVPVQEGDTIDLGGRTVTVIDLPGHTPGSIGLLDHEARVLISGDTVQTGGIVMLGPDRRIETLKASLEHLLANWSDRFDTVFPAHGEFPLPASILPELIESAAHVLAGDCVPEPADFHGRTVMRYHWGVGTFFCER